MAQLICLDLVSDRAVIRQAAKRFGVARQLRGEDLVQHFTLAATSTAFMPRSDPPPPAHHQILPPIASTSTGFPGLQLDVFAVS